MLQVGSFRSSDIDVDRFTKMQFTSYVGRWIFVLDSFYDEGPAYAEFDDASLMR